MDRWGGSKLFIDYFDEELDTAERTKGRIVYNPPFSKTAVVEKKKWLVQNLADPDKCPVRLYRKLLEKRGKHITSKRLFLTPNAHWKKKDSGFFKNCPLGKNEISKWTSLGAAQMGLDIKKRKITNHSNRSVAVSNLAEASVDKNQIAKISGHGSVSYIRSYLQINSTHHVAIVEKIRPEQQQGTNNNVNPNENVNSSKILYKNCVFNYYK
ncbi:hypothetical protein Zmor_026942 [Zophobas morio]|uniref:Tyr recombinase domain-containing protein n=1 Tax=Zophobas morio TaxID=2755281 RepID=A0AA38HWT1_9CUCU|nr:hypothetical protein Zmor_026942 [Zophobas morio]